ncbi:MAG: Universal stress protein family protein [Hyphomicrobiales bacterium]|nr:Universal stress protein family protein [Hyphomicrobiales bacterium]
MKNILAPIELHSSIESVLRTAVLLARRFGGHIEGMPLGPDLPDLVAFDMPVSWTVTDQNAWREMADEAHRRFEAYMMENAVPLRASAPAHHAPTHSWAGEQSFGDSQAASYARVFDVSVMGRPGGERGDARMATAEAALFESGRPVLLAPPAPVDSMGENIVISWNQSTETARAVAFAMPLLLQARKVTVLTIENFMVEGPPGDLLAQKLANHGVNVEAVTRPNARSPGEAVLEQAGKIGCDLLIKGAYTQSRLRQMIFGGATAHILSRARVPVFMAN